MIFSLLKSCELEQHEFRKPGWQQDYRDIEHLGSIQFTCGGIIYNTRTRSEQLQLYRVAVRYHQNSTTKKRGLSPPMFFLYLEARV